MKIIINIKNFVFFLLLILCGCTQNIHFLKGTYLHSNAFQTESLTFIDSVNFDYYNASDDVASSCGQNGKYLISGNILQLNFNIRDFDKPFVYNTLDTTNSDNDYIYFDINIIDTYTKNLIPFSVITLLDTLNNMISNDTSDYSGHITKKIKKSSQVYLIKTSFTRFASQDYYYTSSIRLKANLNYKINFNTIKRHSANYYDGKTLEYTIISIDKTSIELEDKALDNRRKKFILGKPYK